MVAFFDAHYAKDGNDSHDQHKKHVKKRIVAQSLDKECGGDECFGASQRSLPPRSIIMMLLPLQQAGVLVLVRDILSLSFFQHHPLHMHTGILGRSCCLLPPSSAVARPSCLARNVTTPVEERGA